MRFVVHVSSHSQSMNQIKLNWWEDDDFGVCDSNYSLHMIRIMQHCDSNNKLHMIRMTHLMLVTTSFDLNRTFYKTWIIMFFTFLCSVLINLIWIKICKWLESRAFITQIRATTWVNFLYVDLIPLYLFIWLKLTNALDSNLRTFLSWFSINKVISPYQKDLIHYNQT